MRLHNLYTADPFYAKVREIDDLYNPEASEFRDDEVKQQRNIENSVGVVVSDIDHDEPKWDNTPDDDELQSSGFRGGEEAKERAGVPHKRYDRFDPSVFRRSSSESTSY